MATAVLALLPPVAGRRSDAALVRQRPVGERQVDGNARSSTACTKSFAGTAVLAGHRPAGSEDGEMLVIVGASGCGKSTLLRLVAGLEHGDRGPHPDRRPRRDPHVDPSARDIAMVFQNYALYPHMTVFDNMAYGLRIRGTRAAATLPAAWRTRPPSSASSRSWPGARGNSAAASGSASQWAAPSSATPSCSCSTSRSATSTPTLRVQMRAEIRRLQRRLGVTSLYVTHDQVEAMTLGDRLLVLHQGRPVQFATPMEVWARPADTYVAGLHRRACDELPARHAAEGGRRATVGPAHSSPSRRLMERAPITLGVRPENVRLLPGGDPARGRAGGAAGVGDAGAWAACGRDGADQQATGGGGRAGPDRGRLRWGAAASVRCRERGPAIGLIGRGERIRTSGLLLPKQAYYQAVLRPDRGAAYSRSGRVGQWGAAGFGGRSVQTRSGWPAAAGTMVCRRASSVGTSGATSYRRWVSAGAKPFWTAEAMRSR